MTRVLIAGGGIAGLSAALALAQVGLEVTIFERARRLEAVGAGLQLSSNATRILARLGVLDALLERASAPPAIAVRSARSGREIVRMPLGPAVRRWGAPYLVALRADLQAILLDAVARTPAITLELDAALAGFGTRANGVQATIKQAGISRSVVGDALIGADGVHSLVRARLTEGADLPEETGRVAWRALVAADDLPSSLQGPATGLWLGPYAHLVHYAIGGGRQVNIVAVLHERLIVGEPESWAVPGEASRIEAHFASWHADARSLIAAAPAWTCWPLFDRAPLATWQAGPVALIGDAAHPILPFLAQGAAQAIEDAAALAEALAATRDIPKALAHFSSRRQGRARRVQDDSRRLGRIYHYAGPAAAARDLALRVMGGERLLRRYDWLYGTSTSPGVTAPAAAD